MYNRRIAGGVALLTLAGAPLAQTPAPSEPLYVTASRLDDEYRRLPARVTIISGEDIRKSPARTLPELLDREAGVAGTSLFGAFGARETVDLRGFGATAGQNTLILLDGRRLNDVDLAAVDFAAIPLSAIERVEILHGTGGVLYGDGAAGGAINIVTRSPGRTGWSGDVTLTAASYETQVVDANVSRAHGPLATNVYASHLRSDGYRDNNDLRQTNALADVRYLEGRREWFLKLAADDQKLGLPGARRVNPGAGIDQLASDRRGTDTPNDYADQQGVHLTAGVLAFVADDARLTIDGGLRRKRQQASFESEASYLESELLTWSLTPRLAVRHAVFGLPGNTTTGVDYYRSNYDSDRAASRATIATPVHRLDIDQTSWALYVQDTRELNDRTDLTLGARTQQVRIEASDRFDPTAPGAAFDSAAPPFDRKDREELYELGVRRRLGEHLSVYARLERSVRFATVDEIFEFDPATFARVFSPLDPQVSRGVDLGADYARRDLRLSTSVYQMNLENEIHFNPDTFTNDNLDPTRRRGMLISVAERVAPALRAKADYAYTRAEFREGPFAGNEIPLVARHTGALSLLWDVRPHATVSVVARYTGSRRFDNDESNTFEKIPGRTLVDLEYTQTAGAWRWSAAIHNAFDKEIFDYGVRSVFTPGAYNAYPLPVRNYAVTVGRQF